ncbi:uncharacterized protein G2W53_044054 [Senna tora]|uniref:Uncharacterized protein n=1 Tax=Senna tora TaxID=362788 RepID=A0A834SLQ5_9FABA|nr:uncharacterized protein G2W53_044054 [Senna tora]
MDMPWSTLSYVQFDRFNRCRSSVNGVPPTLAPFGF